MPDAYRLLKEHFYRKLARLDHALTFLQWDHMVMMPPGGSEPRAAAIAELTTMRHELLTSPKTGESFAGGRQNRQWKPAGFEVSWKWSGNINALSVFRPSW